MFDLPDELPVIAVAASGPESAKIAAGSCKSRPTPSRAGRELARRPAVDRPLVRKREPHCPAALASGVYDGWHWHLVVHL